MQSVAREFREQSFLLSRIVKSRSAFAFLQLFGDRIKRSMEMQISHSTMTQWPLRKKPTALNYLRSRIRWDLSSSTSRKWTEKKDKNTFHASHREI